jgi:hypothetical protein
LLKANNLGHRAGKSFLPGNRIGGFLCLMPAREFDDIVRPGQASHMGCFSPLALSFPVRAVFNRG